ncbi:putative phosphohydrolase (mutT/nudix family protein) [Oceanicola granulosus HTCC2516]|uniref:Putative phosphohydrolase (MutT/nudix family protein) n=1 Tax=Oceanicola granulosus (strain ATCC BAA-861 / DSM 15982 / KCTC 12143 / HTCC2516) TaxID=314256 RepID=Q2CJS3_OCEGH|nr:CoA pyrophosphatase [Oceanicola granulosus]EAR53066.1 putative phosphohydrolase (mutT/nudix family protein) [Oceanicola granulosus HTCC2516]
MSRLRERLADALAKPSDGSSDYDLNPDTVLPAGRELRPAGVLMAITPAETVLLTVRSPKLKHHPGQVSFPGGKQEPTDPAPVDAALRESEEEIGLPHGRVEILGALPVHETVTGFAVSPFVGLVDGEFEPRPEAGEVAEVFEVPFAVLTDLGRYRVECRAWRGLVRRYWVVPFGPYYIWGATARMLRGLAVRL